MQQVEIEMADVLEMPLNFDALYESICSLCCSQDGFREISKDTENRFSDHDRIYLKCIRGSVFDVCFPAKDGLFPCKGLRDVCGFNSKPYSPPSFMDSIGFMDSIAPTVAMQDEPDIWIMATNSPIR